MTSFKTKSILKKLSPVADKEPEKFLESLILRNDSLNSKDFKYIFEGIKINKTIKEIDISRNDMGGNKMYEYIRDGIKKNTSLVLFRMDKINIDDDNYNIIFEGIKNNKHIDKYSFCYNPVDPKIVFEFFMSQKQVKKLSHLSLHRLDETQY